MLRSTDHRVLALIDRYTYRVTWSADDKEFVALCEELPSLSYLASTRETALTGIVEAATFAVETLIEDKQTPPHPGSKQKLSVDFVRHWMAKPVPEKFSDVAKGFEISLEDLATLSATYDVAIMHFSEDLKRAREAGVGLWLDDRKGHFRTR